MKIISWNIWKGKHFFKILKELEKQRADIICLQEVIENKDDNQAKIIAEKLGYHHTYSKSFTTDRHTPAFSLGNAILSKMKITHTSTHTLSDTSDYKNNAATEPRTALKAKVNNITIICTHLGFSPDMSRPTELQTKQVRNLLSVLEEKNCILAGDFNSRPQSEIIETIEKNLTNSNNAKTPTRIEEKNGKKVGERIDYIFTSIDIKVKSFNTIPTNASDHRIIQIEI